MNIFITNVYAIILVVLYTSPVSAMPFQIDFSIPWSMSQSLVQFNLTETESFMLPSFMSSSDVEEITAAQARFSQNDYDSPELTLLSTRYFHLSGVNERSSQLKAGNMSNSGYATVDILRPATFLINRELKAELTSDAIALSFDAYLYPADVQVDIAETDSNNTTNKQTDSFFFLSAKQMPSQTVPDPSPLWLVGLVLGLTGLTWRLWNLIRTR